MQDADSVFPKFANVKDFVGLISNLGFLVIQFKHRVKSILSAAGVQR